MFFVKNRFKNKRKKRFFTINILFLSLLIFFFVYLYSSFNKLSDITSYLVQEYSNKYNYNLKKIEVIGLTNLNKDEIMIDVSSKK